MNGSAVHGWPPDGTATEIPLARSVAGRAAEPDASSPLSPRPRHLRPVPSLRRFRLVPFHAAEVGHRLGAAAVGGGVVPLQRLVEPLVALVQEAEVAHRARLAQVRGAPGPLHRLLVVALDAGAVHVQLADLADAERVIEAGRGP